MAPITAPRSSALVAGARRELAVVTALTGDADEAAVAMRAALRHWRDRRLPLDHACAVATALHALPAGLVPDDDVASARAYLRGLDANGLLRLF